MNRAIDLPVAKVLQQRNMQPAKGFDQMWPKIFNMIKGKLIQASTFANYD